MASHIIPRPPQSVFKRYGSGSVQLTQGESNFVFPMEYCVLGGQAYAYFDWADVSKWIKIDKFDDLRLFPVNLAKPIPVEYQTGQWIFMKGLLHPRRGFPFPEVLWAVNVFKRVVISIVQSLARKELVLSFIGFFILPWRFKKRIIGNIIQRADELIYLILGPYELQDNLRMAPAKELDRWMTGFIKNLGFESTLGFGIGMIIEYDSAYTLRFQDIMSEVNKESLLADPSKELGRLFAIFAEREQRPHLNSKIRSLVWGLRTLFFIPRIRKAFIQATQDIDFSKLGLGEADRYECLFFGEANGIKAYKYMGRTSDDRNAELDRLHDGKVPQPTEVIGQLTTF